MPTLPTQCLKVKSLLPILSEFAAKKQGCSVPVFLPQTCLFNRDPLAFLLPAASRVKTPLCHPPTPRCTAYNLHASIDVGVYPPHTALSVGGRVAGAQPRLITTHASISYYGCRSRQGHIQMKGAFKNWKRLSLRYVCQPRKTQHWACDACCTAARLQLWRQRWGRPLNQGVRRVWQHIYILMDKPIIICCASTWTWLVDWTCCFQEPNANDVCPHVVTASRTVAVSLLEYIVKCFKNSRVKLDSWGFCCCWENLGSENWAWL